MLNFRKYLRDSLRDYCMACRRALWLVKRVSSSEKEQYHQHEKQQFALCHDSRQSFQDHSTSLIQSK